jgi:hypothetical protein
MLFSLLEGGGRFPQKGGKNHNGAVNKRSYHYPRSLQKGSHLNSGTSLHEGTPKFGEWGWSGFRVFGFSIITGQKVSLGKTLETNKNHYSFRFGSEACREVAEKASVVAWKRGLIRHHI